MSGIVFFATESLKTVVDFYVGEIGADIWLEQPDCTILQYDNMLFGFCAREETDTEGILTFVYGSKADVDVMYNELSAHAREEPVENERYRIYQFFAEDPDGRTVEFQTFLHETEPV